MREADAAMQDVKDSASGGRSDPNRLLRALGVLRAAIHRDLPSSRAAVVDGALDVAARSLEMSRLERAYSLYRRFAFPKDSDGESIDPLK